MHERIAIIGGGISGLSTAFFALERGYPVTLLERTENLGGLAASFDFNGLAIEKYYHFICGGDVEILELAQQLGVRDKVRFRPTKTAFYYNGKYYPFGTPFHLLRFSAIPLVSRFKFGLNVVSSKYSRNWEKLDAISGRQWLSKCLGEKAYQVIWHPLLKVKFGDYYDKISAAWIWHRIHRVALSRKGLFSKEKMGFFEGGSQTLITALEKSIRKKGGEILLESKIRGIEKNENGFSIYLDGHEPCHCDKVVLAVPLPLAVELMESLDSGYARRLASIDFIGVVCGIFRLREKVTDAFWLNINDPRIAANGFIEYSNLNPLKKISPDRIVYIPFYLPVADPWFSMDEDSLKTAFFKMIKTVNPRLTEHDVIGFRAFKSPHAQAICTVGFKEKMPSLSTPVKNLFLIDSTQLYPSDRTLSALIGLAEKMVDENMRSE